MEKFRRPLWPLSGGNNRFLAYFSREIVWMWREYAGTRMQYEAMTGSRGFGCLLATGEGRDHYRCELQRRSTLVLGVVVM